MACRGRRGTLKTLAAHGVGCPTAGLNLETEQLSRHYIAKISLNVVLNLSQPTNKICLFPFKKVVFYMFYIKILFQLLN